MLFATDWVELTAIATFVLGFVTLLLVLVTRSMVKKAGEEIAIERRRIDEATKPRVFPAPHSLWGDDYGRGSEFVSVGGWRSVLPVTNGGPGVALNVRAQLRWEGGDAAPVQSVPTSLGPGESRDLVLEWRTAPDKWDNVTGVLHYNDMTDGLWRTDFWIYDRFHRYMIEVRGTEFLGGPAAISAPSKREVCARA